MSAQEASSPYSKLSPIETNENKQNDIEAVGEEPAEPSNAADPVIGAKTIEKKHATLAQTFSNATGRDVMLMVLGTLGGIVTGVSIPLFNVLFGRIIDELNKNPNGFTEAINRLCLSFLVVACANLFSGFLQVYCWSATGERQTQRFRERYVNALLSQEIGWFDTVGAGQLSTQVAEVVGKIQDGMGRKIGDLIQYTTQVVAALAVAFYLCWELTVVLLAAIPIIGMAGAYMIRAINASTHESFTQYAQAGAVAQESINAVRTVSAFNLQPVFVAKYRVFILEAMRVGIDKGMHVGLGNGAVFGAAFLTYALGFWYGGKLVADDVARGCTENCLTGGTILAVFFSTIMGSMALGQMAPPLTSFATAQASIAIIFDLLGRKPLIDGLSDEGLNLSTMRPNDKIRGEIEVRQVCFAYPSRPSINICKDFDLLIRPGETVALVGASGCGKSTIINLLLRFYDPQSGNILVDGYDIKSLNIKYLRSLIGYVGQEPILFAGTIGDNIAYGLDPQERERLLSIVHSTRSDEGSQAVTTSKKQDLMERIMTAAKAANAHDFIMEFPDGYDTDVGTNGSAMSGGQKQRIAIARALIKKPAILLLDEATSALDVHSEKVVQASIDKLAQSKTQTTIIIAHRLSTIVNADRICVLQDGKVVEQGPHLELIKKTDGVYSELVKMQMMSGEEEVHGKDEQGNADIGRRRTVSKAEEGKDSGRVSRRLSGDQGVPGEVQAEDGAGKKDKEPPVSKDEKKALMSRVFKMIKQYPGLVTTGLGGALFFGALFPCWGLLLAKTQASFFLSDPQEIRERAQLYAFLYIMLAGVAFFGSLAMFYGVVAVGEHVAAEIRSSLYESYFHHPITFFDDVKNSVGNLTTQLAEDTRYVSKALGESFAKQLQAMATLLVAIIIGFKASWIIALIVIGAFPLNIVASAIQMQAISGMQYDHEDDEKKQQQDQQQALANKKNKDTGKGKDEGNAKGAKSNNATSSTMAGSHSTVLSTAFTNMRTVSAFSMQHKVSHHYAIMTQEIASKRTERSIMAGWGFGGSNTVLFLTYSLLFWVGAKLIKDGSVTFEELMTAILSLMLGALGIGQALGDLGDQVQGLQMAKKIFEAMDTANNSPMDGLAYKKGLVPTRSNCHFIQAVSSGKEDGAGDLIEEDINAVNRDELFELTGKIELRNVNFSYPTRPDVPVCTNYNLTINSGEVIAFVGPSGSGKSTIINLLLRFYDPDSGSILVDDMDIRKLNLRYLRSQIGYVGQEPVLFSGTVLDNLSYGRYDVNFTPLINLQHAMVLARQKQLQNGQLRLQRLLYSATHFHKNDDNKQRENNKAAGTEGKSNNGEFYKNTWAAPKKEGSKPKDQVEGDIELGLIVPQSGSGHNNEDEVPADIVSAAKFSHAHDFISKFSQKYDTIISTMGSGYMISGGQKQRLSVARAMLKQPKILLLDEATSALDAQSEHLIQQSIDSLTDRSGQQREQGSPIKYSADSRTTSTFVQQSRPTVIIVAHRLSTIVNADRIIVIEKGEVKEAGSHDHLMNLPNGLYRGLYLKQTTGQH